MAKTVKECDSTGHCYYVFKDAWHVWGRWLLLGVLVAFIILMVPFAGYLMSIWRMKKGLPPVSGTSWMFSNPYKKRAGQIIDEPEQPRPPRYRPHNMYTQYQREQQQYSSGYTTDAEAGEVTTEQSIPSMEEKRNPF